MVALPQLSCHHLCAVELNTKYVETSVTYICPCCTSILCFCCVCCCAGCTASTSSNEHNHVCDSVRDHVYEISKHVSPAGRHPHEIGVRTREPFLDASPCRWAPERAPGPTVTRHSCVRPCHRTWEPVSVVAPRDCFSGTHHIRHHHCTCLLSIVRRPSF